ncbi:hypothetical protein [Leyella stercorea]|nr:hypothetical protein [Leyella stercorea]
MANANDGVIMKAEKLHLLEMQTVIKTSHLRERAANVLQLWK